MTWTSEWIKTTRKAFREAVGLVECVEDCGRLQGWSAALHDIHDNALKTREMYREELMKYDPQWHAFMREMCRYEDAEFARMVDAGVI
jgi:hypothetical protein